MPTLLRERRPTARKQHRCEDCTCVIPIGAVYHRDTLLYDDRIYDWITCCDCAQLVNAVWRWIDPVHDEGIDQET